MNDPISASLKPSKSAPQRYKTTRQLSGSIEKGCIHYLAKDQYIKKNVILTRYIVPEFQKSILETLNHRVVFEKMSQFNDLRILKYIDSFSTKNGVCLVQEYKKIQPLIITESYSLEDIYKLVVKTLEILIQFQAHSPTLLYRNFRPDQFWIDSQQEIYLLDFGFAQIDNFEMLLAATNCIQNPEFLPPEKKRNRPQTISSDLYSLGISILYWLTRKIPDESKTLLRSDGSVNVQGLVPQEVSPDWVQWLEKLLATHPKDRFVDAQAALNALQKIYLKRLPDIKFKQETITLQAKYYGEVLTESISIINPIPDTQLSGMATITDPQKQQTKKNKTGISLTPNRFNNNKNNLLLTVNTNKLLANRTYTRQILIQANSNQQKHTLPLTIITAPIIARPVFKFSLVILTVIALAGGWAGGAVVNWTPSLLSWVAMFLGIGIGAYGIIGASFARVNWFVQSVAAVTAISAGLGLVSIGADVDLILGFLDSMLVIGTASVVVKSYFSSNYSKNITLSLVGLSVIFGLSFGFIFALPTSDFVAHFIAAISGIILIGLLGLPYVQYFLVLGKYRQQKSTLMQP